MNIIHYDQSIQHQFETMLVDYFGELESGIPEHIIRGRLLDLLLGLRQKDILHIAIATENGTPVGFSLYQIDTPESDWCKKEGWGCIREFYIAKAYRRKGFGTALAAFSERHLRKLGVKQLYLTADTAVPFWERCGYRNTYELCSNDLEIMTK